MSTLAEQLRARMANHVVGAKAEEFRTLLLAAADELERLERENDALRSLARKAVEAMEDLLSHTPENRSPYPDGPCIDKEFREPLRTAERELRAAVRL